MLQLYFLSPNYIEMNWGDYKNTNKYILNKWGSYFRSYEITNSCIMIVTFSFYLRYT